MATVTRNLDVIQASPVEGETMAEIAGLGTAHTVNALKFDAAGTEAVQFKWRATSYGSGNLTVKLLWSADTATTGDVVWGASIIAYTPETDSGDVEADAWATENTATDSHLGTNAGRVMQAEITVSNLDSLAADDLCWLRIRRLGGNGSDTMAGDAQLILVTLEYSDT